MVTVSIIKVAVVLAVFSASTLVQSQSKDRVARIKDSVPPSEVEWARVRAALLSHDARVLKEFVDPLGVLHQNVRYNLPGDKPTLVRYKLSREKFLHYVRQGDFNDVNGTFGLQKDGGPEPPYNWLWVSLKKPAGISTRGMRCFINGWDWRGFVEVRRRRGRIWLFKIYQVPPSVALGSSSRPSSVPPVDVRVKQTLERLGQLTLKEIDPLFEAGIFDSHVRTTDRARAAATEMIKIGPEALPHLVGRLGSRSRTSVVLQAEPRVFVVVMARPDRRIDERPGDGSFTQGVDDEAAEKRTFGLTQGDLAFFWIGEIANRKYAPWQFEIGLGRVVYAPSQSRALARNVWGTWKGVTASGLMASLTLDLLRPDHVGRDARAVRPLRAFDPGLLDQLVAMRLRQPFNSEYDGSVSDDLGRVARPGTISAVEVEWLTEALEASPSPAMRREALLAVRRIGKQGGGEMAARAVAALKRLTYGGRAK